MMDSDSSSSESNFSSDSELEDIASAVVSAMKTKLSEKRDKQTPRSTPLRRRSARLKGHTEHNTVDTIDQSVNFTIDKTPLKTQDYETASLTVTDTNQTVFDLSNVDFGRVSNIAPTDEVIQISGDSEESNGEVEVVPGTSQSSQNSAASSRTFENNSSDSENEMTFVLDRKPQGSSLSSQKSGKDATVETPPNEKNRPGGDGSSMTTSEVQLSKDGDRKDRRKKKKKKSEKKKRKKKG